MSPSLLLPRRTLLQVLALMATFRHGAALDQAYCSSENTGSSYAEVTDIYQSNGACYDQCISSYAFAILLGEDCWCSNYAPADTVDVSECDTPCPGYPDDLCGNTSQDLYGYIALTISPSGTIGASSSASSTSSSSAPSTSTTPSLPSTTSTTTSSASIVVSSTLSPTSSQTPIVLVSYITISQTQQSTTTVASSTTSSSSSSSTTSLSGSAYTRTTVVSTQILTISGAQVTQTVTSTPEIVKPNADTSNSRKSGVSAGTIAGAVIGAVVGVALILAGAFFLWRRRRNAAAGPSGTASPGSRRKMERNESVLSKTGLLAAAGVGSGAGAGGSGGNDVEKSSYDAPPYINTSMNRRQSGMNQTNGPSPTSPIVFDGDSQLSRRNSRPLVYDQRLNPQAIMSNWEANGSRASVGTMQDQRDYSRPLGVTNPDPIDD